MSANDRDQLLREAGALKLRAARLRALGDADEAWQATVLLRLAARKELEALEKLSSPSSAEEAGARVEACGLFLEAGDPLRAAEQWGRLPAWISGPTGTTTIARLLPLYQKQVTEFAGVWRSLKGTRAPITSLASAPDLRTALETFPGVAELWWGLAMTSTDRTEASAARARAKELEPSLEHDGQGRIAWQRVAPTIERKLVIVMTGDQKDTPLGLEVVSRVAAQLGKVMDSFFAGAFSESVDLVPSGALQGSFILHVDAYGLPPYALERLDTELTRGPEHVGARGLAELMALLQQNRIRLNLSISSGDAAGLETQGASLIVDAARRKALSKAAEAAVGRTIDSVDVPQADELERIFLILEMVARREDIDAEVIKITRRQVDYYRRAAKILGLLDESDKLTAGGRLIVRLKTPRDRLRTTVVHFETSLCGDAWIRWAGKQTLLGVKADSAFAFLRACVPALSEDTAKRRAQTLGAWHRDLIPHHYAG